MIRRRPKAKTAIAGHERAGTPKPAVDRQTVEWAYRLFLEREPESDDVVQSHLQRAHDVTSLRKRLLNSGEYRRKNPGVHRSTLHGGEPPMPIDTEVAPEKLRALLLHIEENWSRLGTDEPYWSVSSATRYRRANIPGTIDAFYNRGQTIVNNFAAALRRNELEQNAFGSVLDFGCGLGRNSVWLARRFEEVHAYDISASHLDLARGYFREHGIGNVHFHHLSIETLEHLERVDVVFSVVVLQHNPPPLIAVLLDRLLDVVKPGGVAYFQVPTYRPGYSFNIDQYLEEMGNKEGMEMHILPQYKVFRLAERHRCRTLEVMEDSWTGRQPDQVSNTFVLQKDQE